MQARRGESLTGWGTARSRRAIQTERIKVTSDVSEARARMKPRLQRLVLKLERIPGALPQAADDGAPLALNRYSVWERTCLENSVSSRVRHQRDANSRSRRFESNFLLVPNPERV